MLKRILTSILCAATVFPAFAEIEWLTDLDAAKARAKAENKVILANFTGSDWCSWCLRMKREIFTKPEFEAFIADKFVPVKIDIRNKPVDMVQHEKNREHVARYGITGFPSILVLNEDGLVAGGFVGGITDMRKVENILNRGQINAIAYKQAQSLQGIQKAKALYAIYSTLAQELHAPSRTLRRQIKVLDPHDELGLRREDDIVAENHRIVDLLQQATDRDGVLKVINDNLEKVYVENKIELLFLKSRIILTEAKTEADVLAAKDIALQAVSLMDNPEEAASHRARVEANFEDPAAVLEAIQRHFN